MEFWLYVLLFFMPSLIEEANDPIGAILPSEIDPADLECEPISTEAARILAPGQVPEPSARGDFIERRAVICRERLMARGERPPRDDAILSTLNTTAAELTGLVAALDGPLAGRTWLVEVYHPDPRVSLKVSFAMKNALLDRGLAVSDRAPTLAAGDVEVIGRTEPARAWPLACARYAATGSVGPGDALMGVALRDRRETQLHVGVCADGRWRWLR